MLIINFIFINTQTQVLYFKHLIKVKFNSTLIFLSVKQTSKQQSAATCDVAFTSWRGQKVH